MHPLLKHSIFLFLFAAATFLMPSYSAAESKVGTTEIPCNITAGVKARNFGRFAVVPPPESVLRKSGDYDSLIWLWSSKAIELRVELGQIGVHASDGGGYCADLNLETVSARESLGSGWVKLERVLQSDDGLHDVRLTARARPAGLEQARIAIASFRLAPDVSHLKLLTVSKDTRFALIGFDGVAPIKVHLGDEISATGAIVAGMDAQGINVKEYRPDATTGEWVATDNRITVSGATSVDEVPTYPDHGLVTCSSVSGVKPGAGRSFRGELSDNGDYPFRVTIPAGYSSWDGVSESAPFHGFMIFLDASLNSCIYFEIHTRVDLVERPRQLPVATGSVALGRVRGLQGERSGELAGRQILNETTLFSVPWGKDSFADGEVLLITTKDQEQDARLVYREFLGSLKFR